MKVKSASITRSAEAHPPKLWSNTGRTDGPVDLVGPGASEFGACRAIRWHFHGDSTATPSPAFLPANRGRARQCALNSRWLGWPNPQTEAASQQKHRSRLGEAASSSCQCARHSQPQSGQATPGGTRTMLISQVPFCLLPLLRPFCFMADSTSGCRSTADCIAAPVPIVAQSRRSIRGCLALLHRSRAQPRQQTQHRTRIELAHSWQRPNCATSRLDRTVTCGMCQQPAA